MQQQKMTEFEIDQLYSNHACIYSYIYIENVNPFHIALSDSNQLHVHQGKKNNIEFYSTL